MAPPENRSQAEADAAARSPLRGTHCQAWLDRRTGVGAGHPGTPPSTSLRRKRPRRPETVRSVCVRSSSANSDSAAPRTQPASLLCPRDSPGKEAGGGCRALLQGAFPSQGQKLGVLHCRQILSCLSHREMDGWMYTHTHTHTHSHTHVCMLTHTCSHTHSHMLTHTQTRSHTHTLTHSHTHTRTRSHTLTHTLTHAHTHTHTHTYTHTRALTHTHSHTCAHTHALTR